MVIQAPTPSNHEEARKIQFSGRSSYMIALPKHWVREMGLGPGDRVLLTKQNNISLILTPMGAPIAAGKGEVTIETSQSDNSGSLVRKLISLYLLAYNIIRVKGKEGKLVSTQRDTVKEAVRRNLIGTEVIADSTDEITLQVLLSFPELSVENALRRMFIMAASMYKDALRALIELDKDTAQAVLKTDDEVDRFSLYAIRQLKIAVENSRILKEMKLSTPRDCLGYRLILKSVERVADHAYQIAQGVLTLRQPLDESTSIKITELSEFAIGLFEESGQAFFTRNYMAADNVVERAKIIPAAQNEVLDALANGQPESTHELRLIVEDIRRTAEYASDIAEIVLNLSVDQIVVEKPNP